MSQNRPLAAISDYDEKLERLLAVAAEIFAEKGYHHASIRDLARRAGVSLSGLYYYFDSKEELLYRIQDRSLRRLLSNLERRLEGIEKAEEKLQVLIHNHLQYLTENMPAMRVLTYEYHALDGEYRTGIRKLRQRYSSTCTEILREVRRSSAGGDAVPLNVAVSALFGMVNWVYTWYRPGSVPVDRLAEQLYRLFVGGFAGRGTATTRVAGRAG
jgi:AcrR family transcriptional regulator